MVCVKHGFRQQSCKVDVLTFYDLIPNVSGDNGGVVLVGLGGGGRMLTAGIAAGSDVLVTTGGDRIVVRCHR